MSYSDKFDSDLDRLKSYIGEALGKAYKDFKDSDYTRWQAEEKSKELESKIQTLQEQNKAQAEEIEKLKADREVMLVALNWIAQTDVSKTTPDFLWLQNWRNTRKEAARQALKSIGEIE